MDVFDDLARAIRVPRTDWHDWFATVFLDLLSHFVAGLAIGVGIAAGLALAG